MLASCGPVGWEYNIMINYKTKIKQFIAKLQNHKLVTFAVVVSTVIMISAVGYLLLSQHSWSDYEASYVTHINDAKLDIDHVVIRTLSEKNVSSSDKINNLLNLKSNLIKGSESYCKVDAIIKWQSFAKQLAEKVDICEQRKQNLDLLLAKIGNVAEYLKAEQGLSVIISTAVDNTNKNNQSDKWSKIEAYWSQAITDAAKLTDISQFNAIKTIAISNLTVIANTWHQMSGANDAKNRQQFEDARTNLAKAYAGLVAISDVSTKQFNTLVAELNASYAKANLD